jgi:hypothetical protein
MKTLRSLLIITLTISFCACGVNTKVTSSWRKPNATANGYKNIFVTAMSSNIPAKQAVETGLKQQLKQKGLTVEKSMDVFPPNFSTQTGQKKEYVVSKIQGTGADGILTIALLKQETESRFVPSGGYWNPGSRFGYYNRFWSYYSNWNPYLSSAGYYDNRKIYYLETNLYDAHTEELIWAAQSETYDPSNIDDFLKGYIKSIYKQMVKDGLITPQTGS